MPEEINHKQHSDADPERKILVPVSATDITAGWLQKVLQNSFPGIEIKQVNIERVGERYGLASQVFRCKWQSEAPPHSTIVKLWDTESPAGRREIDFYTNFADLLKAWIPTCYYGEVDIKTGQGVLIFKDLTPVAQGDCLLQLPLPLAIKTAHNLAGIHASWQDHEALERAEWLPNVSVWARTADWFDPRRSLFLERFGDRLDRNAIRLLDRIELAQVTANQRLANAPVTLLHGDLHLDNYIFVDGTYPVLLDWARCAQGSLSLDLYDLLFSIVKERDRDRIFETYLEAFEKHASQGLDQAEVWNQLGGAFLRKFVLNTCGVANWQPASPREWAMIDTELERTFSALSYWLKQDPELFTFLE